MTTYEIAPCPACGSAEAETVAGADDIRSEMEQLWSFHMRRLHAPTPPEHLHDRVAFSQDPALRIVRCSSCTLLYRNPRELAGDIIDLYRNEQTSAAVLRTLYDSQRKSYRRQARNLTNAFGRVASGLEVGSYVGAFLSAARDEGWRFSGVDVNQNANNFARSAGLDVATGTVNDARGKFNVIAFWNCFDQLPDPLAAVHAAREHLHDNGMLAIRVPNGDFYAHWRLRLATHMRPVARAVLAHNNLLGFPYRHGFSATSLDKLLGRAGFRIDRVIGDTLVPVADQHTRVWAAAEEAIVKRALKTFRSAPWLEVYARAT